MGEVRERERIDCLVWDSRPFFQSALKAALILSLLRIDLSQGRILFIEADSSLVFATGNQSVLTSTFALPWFLFTLASLYLWLLPVWAPRSVS